MQAEAVTTSEEAHAWARELVGKIVMHSPTCRIGRVQTFYDGVATVFISPVNDQPVTAPVLALEDGNTLVAERAEGGSC